MRKKPFVVCLMNGMGIEESKSYSIYSSEVMPTLDALTNRYLFTGLESSGNSVGLSKEASATREIGYLNIGAGNIVKQSIEIVNEKIEKNALFTCEALKTITDHVIANDSKLHLITLIGDKYSEDSPAHLRKMIEHCTKLGIKKIYLHLYLGANNNSLSKTFPKYTSMIHRIINVYPNVQISTVAGIKHLKDSSGITVTKELYKITVGGIGEHWINYNDAVDSNYKRKYLEEDIIPFLVAEDGLIENTDGVFLFNYENDLGSVYTDLLIQPAKYMYTNNNNINIKIASLFPLQNQTTISCLNYEPVKTSFYNNLNQYGIKHLLIANKENIPYINYYFNGCNKEQATQVLPIEIQSTGNYDLDLANKFQLATNKVIEAINSDFYDLIIVDYQIEDNTKQRTTENIKNALINLDKNITQLYNAVIQKNGMLYLTSAYGINDVMYNNKEELVNVDFSKKVPFVIVDNELSKDNYSLISGTLSDISTTILNTLEIPPMDGMTGKNILLKIKNKKVNNKTLLIIIIAIVVLAVAVIAMTYFGII